MKVSVCATQLNAGRPLYRGPVWLVVATLAMVSEWQAAAAKIAYIHDGQNKRDTLKLIRILRAQGHDVTVIPTPPAANVLTAEQFAAQGYQLLIADENISSGNVGNKFRNSPIPVITWEGFLYSGDRSAFNADSGLVGGTYGSAAEAAAVNGGAGADFGQVVRETAIHVINPSHPLAAGLPSGLVHVFDPNHVSPDPGEGNGVITFVGRRTLIPGAVGVATVPGFPNGYAIMGVDVGVRNADGTTNRARWVHLPWNDTDPADRMMVEPSFFLFEAAVAWALGLPQPTKIYNLLPEPGGFMPTNTPVTFSVDKTNAAGSPVAVSGIRLRINDVDVTSQAIITDGGARWQVTYNQPFVANRMYVIVASATAADGGFSARQTEIDTFDPNNFSFEAEDFNFTDPYPGGTPGQYFDTIALCDTVGGGTPNCYYDRVGTQGVDKNEINNRVSVSVPQTNEVYRFGSQIAVREEFVDTFITSDPVRRAKYVAAGLPDYEVRNVVSGEWLNYTRTFPTGTYHIYARMASPNAFTVQMDFVDNAASPVQNLVKIGRFVGGPTAGYTMVPLTDDAGAAPLVVTFDGRPRTIRVTARSDGVVMNFFMLVPTRAVINEPPTVEITSPVAGTSLFEGQEITITARVSDDGVITNVLFYAGLAEPLSLIGSTRQAPYQVRYTLPRLGGVNTYLLRVVATDNGGLSGQAQISVRVTDPTLRFVSTAVGRGADVQLNEFNTIPQDTASNTAQLNARTASTVNEVIALRFDLSGYPLGRLQDVTLNLVNYRNNGQRVLHFYGVKDGTVGLDNNGFTPGFTDNTWDEASSQLRYSTMPGLYYDGTPSQGYDTNNIVDLGTLTMHGTKGQPEVFASQALTDFLNQSPDPLVTILVDVDTLSTGQSRFASKEATALDGDTPTGAPGEFAPYLRFRVAAEALRITEFNLVGNQLTLRWVGGSGPFAVQHKERLEDAWTPVQTGITGSTLSISISGQTGFYRVVGQ
ncbi:MAG: Ig-like domain-containing protein [Verrucomicrobiota bacterium]|nr:Ig-like domain-containing protein [Limisphaera sp.]MDW8381208.1 Ig-like domain-containing protein [Verrucomicrobiota bacterium]